MYTQQYRKCTGIMRKIHLNTHRNSIWTERNSRKTLHNNRIRYLKASSYIKSREIAVPLVEIIYSFLHNLIKTSLLSTILGK